MQWNTHYCNGSKEVFSNIVKSNQSSLYIHNEHTLQLSPPQVCFLARGKCSLNQNLYPLSVYTAGSKDFRNLAFSTLQSNFCQHSSLSNSSHKVLCLWLFFCNTNHKYSETFDGALWILATMTRPSVFLHGVLSLLLSFSGPVLPMLAQLVPSHLEVACDFSWL